MENIFCTAGRFLFVNVLSSLVVGVSFAPSSSWAEETFYSLRYGETFMRSGNSKKHPVVSVYKMKGLPFQILDVLYHKEEPEKGTVKKTAAWYRVRDFEGQTGWVHYTQLSPRPTVMVLPGKDVLEVPLYAKINAEKPMAFIPRYLVMQRIRCDESWCLLRYEDEEYGILEGYIDQAFLWGSKKD